LKNILVQFPTLGRPKKFLECFRLYVEKLSGYHQVVFNIICDDADLTMQDDHVRAEIAKIIWDAQQRLKVKPFYDIFFDAGTTKISAINSHINIDNYDIVICASDDMIPYVDNWDDRIAKDMQRYYPDTDGCLSYSDGRDIGNLITFSILGKRLYQRFGYIYHPDYVGLYCDNEFTDEVNKLGKVTYLEDTLFGHEHYAEEGNRNSGDLDFAAKKTLRYSGRDGTIYEKRKSLGFPKQRITNDI